MPLCYPHTVSTANKSVTPAATCHLQFIDRTQYFICISVFSLSAMHVHKGFYSICGVIQIISYKHDLNFLRDQYSTIMNLVLFDARLAYTGVVSCPPGLYVVVTVVRGRM